MFMRMFSVLVLLVAASPEVSGQSDPGAVSPSPPAPSTRQQEVRDKGAKVMPFSLDATVHRFDKTDTGGVQQVLVRGKRSDQIDMIRSHLHEIAQAFQARDFSKPMHIHGTDMPGLETMKAAGPGELDVAYHELEGGAEIDYIGHTPRMIDAVHRWFDAQLRDHGRDATSSPANGDAAATTQPGKR